MMSFDLYLDEWPGHITALSEWSWKWYDSNNEEVGDFPISHAISGVLDGIPILFGVAPYDLQHDGEPIRVVVDGYYDWSVEPSQRAAALAESTSASAVLRRAAQLITINGFSQGELIDETGAMCALGAIAVAVGLKPAYYAGNDHIYEAVGKHPAANELAKRIMPDGYSYGDIYRWSDNNDKAFVVSFLNSVAKELEEEESR